MPTRHGGMLERRTTTWPRDSFCRSTIAPRSSRPTRWNVFLPISMPIAVTMLSLALWSMARAPRVVAPAICGQEHGRSIPLADVQTALMDVRFEANNGHDADVTRCLLMTQKD